MATRNPVKIAVIGTGSIGSRHTRILRALGHEVVVVSRRVASGNYRTIRDALQQDKLEYIVIASKTSQHSNDLQELSSAEFAGKVLVEKPLFASTEKIPSNDFSLIAVGYNLRFHPAIKWLGKTLPQLGAISSAYFYSGQYLPMWRQGIDYTISSSASKSNGGGVLRDLSHEIDLAQQFFGNWHHLAAAGGQFGNLEIDSDDTFSILLQTKYCPIVSIHLNYLDRLPQRNITINGNDGTIFIDLISGSVRHNNDLHTYNFQSDDTYIAEHQAMFANESSYLCSIEQGLTVVKTITAIEKASANHEWISQ